MSLLDVSPPPEEVRQRAHEILSRAEFGRHESVVERVLNWIGDQLSRFRFGLGRGPGILGDLVSVAILAAVVALIVVLVRAFMRRRRPPRPEPADDLTIEVEAGRTASDWQSDAERLEAAGEWREAMRARYRELVRSLIEAGVLADIPGRTTGEYRSELIAARPQQGDAFRELTDLFERVWYGGAPTDAADNQRFRRLADRVRVREVESV